MKNLKNKTMKYALVICLTMLSVVNVKSQTFFVDVSNGNDTLPGTISQPWQRLDTAINRLSVGDTLFIRGGNYTYLGQILFQKNGTSVQPIVISGYQNEFPIVQGFTIGFSSWLYIEKIDFFGPQVLPLAWKDMDTIVVDNPAITIDPIESWDTYPFRIDSVLAKYSTYANFFNYGWNTNTTWESNSTNGLYLVNSSDINIRQNKIHQHTQGIRLRDETKRILIDNNEIHHCLNGIVGYCDTANYTYSFGYSTISNNNITQSFINGILLNKGAHHNLINSNLVTYSGQNHICTYNLDTQSDSSGYNIISDNVVAYGGYYAEFMRYPGPTAISLHSTGPECKAIGNFIAYQVSTARFGLNLQDGNGLAADYNPDGSEFINNVCYRNMGNGINIVKSKNNKVIHNTIIESGYGDSISVKHGVAIQICNIEDSINIISNNIFHNCSKGGILARDGNLANQTYIDYNLYFFSNGAPFAADGISTLYYTIPFAGFELNGIVFNPLIIDTLGHIAISSPAISGGGIDYSYPFDKDNFPRNSFNPTVGAYENFSAGIIENHTETINLKLYPNPTSNILIIEAIDINTQILTDFNIYNINGVLVFSKSFDSSKMNFIRTQNFPSGTYIYQYGQHSGKFIKQ